MICASLISDTIRISCWNWDVMGQSSGSTSQTFLIRSRHFCDGMRRGLSARCSMISTAALAPAPHFCAAGAADSFAIFSFARFLRLKGDLDKGPPLMRN